MPTSPPLKNRFPRSALLAVAGLCVVATIAAADYWVAYSPEIEPQFVGRDACVKCHQDQTAAFDGSHHDKAMDVATDQTVLADFSDVTFEHHDVTSRFYRSGDRFMIHTEGETGDMQDFEVKYVFGVDPLQQYMVEFDRDETTLDGELPRLQVLRISWDVAKKKWFYLSPPDVKEKLQPGDPLHWTGIAQRWQTMCADCHSTNLQPNFDVAAGKYHTTFSEIDVSCESCHGPGSLHVEMANSRSLFWDRHHGIGLAKLKGNDPQPQLQSCAPCHSRRSQLDGTFTAGDLFTDHYELERLTPATYHDDGQIKDEVYVYGSFIQSKMYHKGIRCTDCHDPHSLELKHPGNQTCTSCHQHAAGKYDAPSHHHHAVGTPGAMCVNCHMPHTTYMDIDQRRDHSLRVPRPDLSVKLGTPNACAACHIGDGANLVDAPEIDSFKQYADWVAAAQSGGSAAVAKHVAEIDLWCDQACDKWYGEQRKTPPHFAEAFAAFRRGEPGGASALLKIATSDDDLSPAIARASAWDDLGGSAIATRVIREAKRTIQNDSETAMVRAAAVRAFGDADAETASRWILPLLDDASKLVRVTAVGTLLRAGVYPTLSTKDQRRIDAGAEEIKDSVDLTGDRGSTHMMWAGLCESMQRFDEASQAYETAISVQPNNAGPRTNYAALLEQLAAGPWQSRRDELLPQITQLRREELPLLKRDAELVPNLAPVQYRYGLMLYLVGDADRALVQLKKTMQLDPETAVYRQAYQALRQQIDAATSQPPSDRLRLRP